MVTDTIASVATPAKAEELKGLANQRLIEAKALLQSGLYAGAWYLAGYAVELALKAIVCRNLGLLEYPEKAFKGALKSHNVDDLLTLAGLAPELDQKLGTPEFDQNWSLISTWDVQDRYQTARTQGQVQEFISALEDKQNGVLVWLSSRW